MTRDPRCRQRPEPRSIPADAGRSSVGSMFCASDRVDPRGAGFFASALAAGLGSVGHRVRSPLSGGAVRSFVCAARYWLMAVILSRVGRPCLYVVGDGRRPPARVG